MRRLALFALALVLAVPACTLAGLRGPALDPSPFAATPSATLAPPPVATTPAAIPEGYRVRVPRLGIDLPISEGVISRDIELQRTPEDFAFHLPGTAIPGQGGNSYFYAHARRGMFLGLWEARVGDVVEIVTPSGTVLTYEVAEVRPLVPPNDVSVAAPTPDERLTLQTSTGPDPEDPRFVVIARPR